MQKKKEKQRFQKRNTYNADSVAELMSELLFSTPSDQSESNIQHCYDLNINNPNDNNWQNEWFLPEHFLLNIIALL